MVNEPATLKRPGYVFGRLRKVIGNIEAAGGVPNDPNGLGWLKHSLTLMQRVQKNATTEKQAAGNLRAKALNTRRVMIAYRNRIADLEAQLEAMREGISRNKYKLIRGPDKAMRKTGAIIPKGDAVSMAHGIAEAITGKAYVYRMKTGAVQIRRNECARGELVGVYDEGCDWRDIAGDLVA